MQRSWHAVLAAVVVVGLLAPPALAAAGGAGADRAEFADPAPLQTGDIDPDSVYLRAAVAPDGDAQWRIEYRVLLGSDENRTDAFESLQRDVRANGSRYREQFAGRMVRTVAAAENATGREMAVRNVTVTATTQQIGRSYGVVTYRFEWTGFAAVDGERLRVGDAIAGFFIDSGTRLELAWPEGYEATTVRQPADERTGTTAVWTGPTDFGPDRPQVVVAPAGGGSPASFPVWLPLAGVLVVALAAGGGLLWWRRGRREDAAAGGEAAGGSGPSPADGEAATATAGAAGAAGDGDGTDDGDDEAIEEEPPLELLSPEERVLRVVSEHGGRAKQQQIVSELDWSAARTSQVVGSLRDDGRVETFRLGRENVVRLPEEDGEERP